MRRISSFAIMVAAAALPVMAARADELPMRKAGLWEMTMQMAGGRLPAMTMQHCTDESTDREMNSTFGPMSKQVCTKQTIQKTATGYVVDSECGAAGVSSTTHADITGDFNTAYTVTATTQSEGRVTGAHNGTMTIDAKWLGACTAGQKPGDIVMPGGLKMNIKDLAAMRGMMKR